jgi:hypothetical protein
MKFLSTYALWDWDLVSFKRECFEKRAKQLRVTSLISARPKA